jgi:hypothetical protein
MPCTRPLVSWVLNLSSVLLFLALQFSSLRELSLVIAALLVTGKMSGDIPYLLTFCVESKV